LKREKFEFHRHIDGLVYAFERRAGIGKKAIYDRNDKAVRVIHDEQVGWSIWSDEGELVSRVWDVLPQNQDDCPTEGI
jgi:hypothetical protein